MGQIDNSPFPEPVTNLFDRRLPEKAIPAGYSALIQAYNLKVPLPHVLFAAGLRHRSLEEDGWRILSTRYTPQPTLEAHLVFALKYEGLHLWVVKRLFQTIGPGAVEDLVLKKPTGAYVRRIWFLYEWLMGSRLDLADASAGRYIPVVDPIMQWSVKGETSPRHRVRNNLPGVPMFCPLVFRTQKLDKCTEMDLPQRARKIVANVPKDVMARAAAFLLLKDSMASFTIEGERPPQDRIQRWGRVNGEAGRQPLDQAELLRLQKIVIGDSRFVELGFRKAGGFVGEHDRETGMPLSVHPSARPEDLSELVQGMIEFERGPARMLDPVVGAAVLAFGFVYVHPFEDGNGRLHRYLIHHVLAVHGFNPPGVIFPVSATILERIDEYRRVLEDFSEKLLAMVDWEATERGNIRILNDSADFYRFFDATLHAEFLYDCVRQTIEKDLPEETHFLRLYDRFRNQVMSLIDMPETTVNLLFRFLRQNQGVLSQRASRREFKALTEQEADRIESVYADLF